MTPGVRRRIAQAALAMSLDIRARPELDFDTRMPVDIYDVCHALGVPVQFVDINMEGMYVKHPPRILISALRPYPRRVFTCAHELGHHVFEHGSTIDELVEGAASERQVDPNELLVQLFAGFMLMPVLGVSRAFSSRGWDIRQVGPAEFLTVACSFGVSYAALLTHMSASLEVLSARRAQELGRIPLPKVRELAVGLRLHDPLVLVDRFWQLPTIDVECNTYILFPAGSAIIDEGAVLQYAGIVAGRPLLRADKPGVCKIVYEADQESVTRLVRVARFQYVGLSRYRYLPCQDDRDEEEEEM